MSLCAKLILLRYSRALAGWGGGREGEMRRRKGRRDGEEEGKERWGGGREGEMGRRKGRRDGEEEGKERWGGGREREMVEEGMQLSGQYHHVHPHT